MGVVGSLKVKELTQAFPPVEERAIHDLLHQVVPEEFLLQLVHVPRMFQTKELQQGLCNVNLLQLHVGLEVVLCMVFKVEQR